MMDHFTKFELPDEEERHALRAYGRQSHTLHSTAPELFRYQFFLANPPQDLDSDEAKGLERASRDVLLRICARPAASAQEMAIKALLLRDHCWCDDNTARMAAAALAQDRERLGLPP